MIRTELRNADLEALAGLLSVQHDAKHDAVIPAAAISMVNGRLFIEGMGPDGPAGDAGEFSCTDVFDEHLADKLGIPLPYVRRMRADRPDLLEANVHGWIHGNPHHGTDASRSTVGDPVDPDGRRFFVRTFVDPDGGPGIARGLLANNYRRIDHLDVITAALDGLRSSGVNAAIERCNLSERRMVVDITCPDVGVIAEELFRGYRNPFAAGELDRAGGWSVERALAAAEAEGDVVDPVVWAGFQISNSELGGGSFTLAPRVVFKICRNGLKLTGDAMRRVHIGARLEEGTVDWSEETQLRNLELVKSMTSDAVTAWTTPEFVTSVVERLRAADERVEEPAKVVELVGSRLRFTKETQAGVLEHFIRGGQMTAMGILNAVTSYAQAVESPDLAYELEAAAFDAFEVAAGVA